MDIRKELESFKTVAIAKGWSIDGETTQTSYRFYSLTTNSGWEMWQAAKAQAVPEGFVLVSEDQAKDTDRLNFLLGGETYIRTVTHRDIQNDEYEKIGEHFQLTEVFWIDGFNYWENTSSNSERGAIDKAIIEAREQSND